jgi:predicted membrane protein
MRNRDNQFEGKKEWQESHRRGKIAVGVFVVLAGVLFLLKRTGVEFPHWLLSWKTFLIAAGVVSLIKHKAKKVFGFFLIAIGSMYVLAEECSLPHIGQFIWPIAIILFGLAMIFKPRNNKCKDWKHTDFTGGSNHEEDYIRSSTIFGGAKKNIISKNFKGGEVKAIFGGSELNFMQADISGKAELEITAVFGGVKLIVPRNWEVQSELSTFCGGIEDNTIVNNDVNAENKKVLILNGNAVFGGIEIVSY